MKKIIIGADSAGYTLKEHLKSHLINQGYEVLDMGTDSEESCHYPIFADKVCKAVTENINDSFGILVCGTGIGMSMCANKHKGIRAALCSDTFSARMTRLHNDANVLCFGERVVGYGLACDLVDNFIDAEYEGAQHAKRVEMIIGYENGNFGV